MKERLKELNYKYRLSIVFFMFLFLILSLSPLSGDVILEFDLGRNTIRNINLDNFLVNFFANNKFLFNFLFAGLLSSFIYTINTLVDNIRNKHFYLFIVIELLLVGVLTFSYNYTSIKGAIFYTIPALLIFLYFIYFNKKILLNLILSLVIINLNFTLGLYFFIANIIFFILSKENKKWWLLLVQALNLFLIQNMNLNMFVGDLSLLQSNISLSIKNLFSNNILIFILGAVPINYYLKDNLKKNMYRRVKLFIFNIPLIFALSYNFGNYFPVNLDLILTRYSGVFAVENYYYLFYFILYIYFYIMSINHFIKNDRLKNYLNIFQLISILIFIQSVLEINFDRSLFIFIIFSVIISNLLMFSYIKVKIYPRLMILITASLFIYYISIFTTIRILENKRVEFIKEQIAKNNEKIVIMASPFRLILKSNPVPSNFDKIKEYYKIPQEKNVEVEYLGIFKKIEKKVK